MVLVSVGILVGLQLGARPRRRHTFSTSGSRRESPLQGVALCVALVDDGQHPIPVDHGQLQDERKDENDPKDSGDPSATSADDGPFGLNASSGAALLLLLAVLYGANVPLIKDIENAPLDINPPEVLALRFVTASLLVVPWVWANVEKATAVLMPAAELAFWLWLGYFLQILGLEKTPASITAITTALCGVTVQSLEFLLEGKPFRPVVVFSSLVNLLGLYLFVTAPVQTGLRGFAHGFAALLPMWMPPLRHEALFDFLPGEALAIAGAICFGIHVYRCNCILRDPENEETAAGKDFELALAIVQCILVTIVSLVVTTLDNPTPLMQQVGALGKLNPIMWLKIAACGIICTGVPSVVELYAFKVVRPEVASLIYCTIPLWGALLGVVFLRDGFTFQSILGGIMILGSSFAPSILEQMGKGQAHEYSDVHGVGGLGSGNGADTLAAPSDFGLS